MIGIKGMELPKSCSSCEITEYYCHICPIIGESKLDYKDNRNPNCPLVDIGKEDMSWEELVEKCKSEFNVDVSDNKSIIINLSCGDLVVYFNKDKSISFYTESEKNSIYDKSYFKMYQIIKSLVGDER